MQAVKVLSAGESGHRLQNKNMEVMDIWDREEDLPEIKECLASSIIAKHLRELSQKFFAYI